MKAFTVGMSDIQKCPKKSMSPKHYRLDRSCRCKEEDILLTTSFGGHPFVRVSPDRVVSPHPKFEAELSPTMKVVVVKHDDLEWTADLFGPGIRVNAQAGEPMAAIVELEGKIETMFHHLGRDR